MAPQTVDAGERAMLSGRALDPDGSVVEQRWEQVAGVEVSIQENRQGAGQFVAPLVETTAVLTFRLTVTDNGGATANVQVSVTVEPYGSLSVSVSGKVRSHVSHAPVSGARVTVSQHGDGTPHLVGEAVTDESGSYAVEVPAHPGRLAVHVDAEGFAKQSKIVALRDGASSRIVHLDLVPVHASYPFATVEGVTVRVQGQPVVSLPANAVVTAAGEAYRGQAVASVAVLDPSKDPTVMPGDFLEWDADANASTPIESYGAINVRIAAANGAPLQLGSSNAAQVSIPLASGRSPANAPPEMPLYYWSNELGYWVEEGRARLEGTPQGRWGYVGAVTHFTTWNADVSYESVWVSGCVVDWDGEPVSHADVTARGIDYVGRSSATADGNGRFEIRVRPDSEVEFVAASRDESSEAVTLTTGPEDSPLKECLALLGERGLTDFPIKIEGESGTVEVCVRDHECEDGDAVSVDVEGRNLFAGELVNDARCSTLEVEAGREYVIELTALNGTGFKGECSFADANTGEIRVSGLNAETRIWRHREGAGSKALIVVATDIPQPFTIMSTPTDAMVRLLGNVGRVYEPDMELVAGEYRVEVGSPGYRTREVVVAHGSESPTRFAVILQRIFEPGDIFVETLASGGVGPEMVVIPAGRFQMGCHLGRYCDENELPLHNVTIPEAFAVSVQRVTFDDWDRCLADGGCGGHRPVGGFGGRGLLPVINVSWNDSQTYVSWLSSQTGVKYRLPSEAEWQYVGREGTGPEGAFGEYEYGSFPWEWVTDCWNKNYANAPTNGAPWLSGDCDRRVRRLLRNENVSHSPWGNTRGGDTCGDFHYDYTGRCGSDKETRSLDIGFRVVRKLTP